MARPVATVSTCGRGGSMLGPNRRTYCHLAARSHCGRRSRSRISFFIALGSVLPVQEGSIEGRWADRIVGSRVYGVDTAMMQTPDGTGDSS